MPRDRSRGVAHGLDREPPRNAVPERRQAVHLGVAADRLEELLSLRSERQADRAADVAHRTRGGQHRPGRRGAELPVLHRARRRQLPEDPAAPRRARWQERQAADRSGAAPHRQRVAERQVLHRRGAGARHPAGDAAHRQRRQDRQRAGEERHDEIRRARPEESRDVHLPGRGRQDEAPRADRLPVELRSDEEISRAGERVRRAGVGGGERALHPAEHERRSTASSC